MSATAKSVLILTDAALLLADTEAGLTAGEAFSAVVTEAALNAVPNLQTVPATLNQPETQAPAATSYELSLAWLQDWDQPEGLSAYAYMNDTLLRWFSLALTAGAEPLMTGEIRVVAGSYGGPAGTPLLATAVWPAQGKPTHTPVPPGLP